MTAAVTPSNSTVNHVPEPAFNSLIVAMLLTAAGGFLDAFSYVGQGHVFANVMTGNLVLSAISSIRGDWTHVARLLLPLASYVAGASAGAMLRSSAQKRMIASPPGPGSRDRDRNPRRNRLAARGVLQRGHRLGHLLPDRGQELLLFARGGVDLRVNHADRQSAAIRRGRVPVAVGDGQPEVETASHRCSPWSPSPSSWVRSPAAWRPTFCTTEPSGSEACSFWRHWCAVL